ncbi:MAG: microviridin/marinostatin family tricyclic proteinase inhibitor [Planctomycetota bacterium]
MNDDKKTPFFARFLEGQEYPEVKTDVKAGKGPLVTMKWPSDDDDLEQTMKAPSDSDEI